MRFLSLIFAMLKGTNNLVIITNNIIQYDSFTCFSSF